MSFASAGAMLFLSAYIAATSYLVYRDDLLGTAVSRTVEMQYAYEDRIAALRAEIDRVTSRHAVQALNVEEQLALLLQRQEVIERQQAALDALAEKARASGLAAGGEARAPQPRPAADVSAAESGPKPLAYAPAQPEAPDAIAGTLMRSSSGNQESNTQQALRPLVAAVQSSLERIEDRQSQALDTLTAQAENEADKLSDALAPIGITFQESARQEGPRGGPFIPAGGLHFVERTAMLSRTLDEIAELRRAAAAMPLAMPVEATRISSRFGYRKDPFLNRPALHAGLDFVAAAGAEVRATAAGEVVFAGWNGGYGYMVEISHTAGLSTRYGHLSAILVEEGQPVSAGMPIGRVGSTGRSTGPHLHYETRRGKKPVNPAPYLSAGRAL